MFTVSTDWLCEFRGYLCRQLSEFLSSLTITCYIGLLLLISNDILIITDVIDAELLTAHLVFLIVLLLTLTVGVTVDSSSVVMGFIPMLVIILVILSPCFVISLLDFAVMELEATHEVGHCSFLLFTILVCE